MFRFQKPTRYNFYTSITGVLRLCIVYNYVSYMYRSLQLTNWNCCCIPRRERKELQLPSSSTGDSSSTPALPAGRRPAGRPVIWASRRCLWTSHTSASLGSPSCFVSATCEDMPSVNHLFCFQCVGL